MSSLKSSRLQNPTILYLNCIVNCSFPFAPSIYLSAVIKKLEWYIELGTIALCK
ncbi:hypothetical protein L211DRAFT_841077 [Terfezia boudieri ATCC MYA-4762]|uniref:Uncharacterized protein n=1 Tax=Terfezia boudieri ATCC MYA-4762 TaxID=1051890 RepID=A0A3N4LEG0_9PEZI|nr:hypothetical protein L211DRAFT_841077 [Terfezia boudieri ATCC MYA-4762]